MQKFLLFLTALIYFNVSQAQTFTATFTGGAASIPGQSNTQKCFPVTVAGVGTINAVTRGLAQVCLNITHPYDDELEIVLTAPDGTVVPLSLQNGGSGNNYNGTCFSATATQSIKFGTSPFAGTYLPEGHIGAVNNGQNANGTWRICIQDRRSSGNAGSLTSFSITFTTTPAPLPPSLPVCSSTLPSTSSCATATSVCDFNGLCGNTNGSTVQDWPNSGLDGPCFGLQNNSFIKFIASATTASFSVWVPTSSLGGNYNQGGIQMLFFSGTCGSGAVTTHGCYPHILPYSAAGFPIVSVVSATGLTPGNTYYLMIDGFNMDNCTFTIAANSGVNILNITPAAPAICPGSNVNLTASGGNGMFTWSPATGLSATTGATVTATPIATTTYTVTSTGIGSCPITKDVIVTVNARPVITSQPSTGTQNLCTGGTTSALNVVATSGTGAITGYQWYSNTIASNTGGTLIPGATSATYTPSSSPAGTLYYYCVITNSATCSTSSAVSGAVNISPALAAPVATTTLQPTCITNGTITVTAPLGVNFQYSIDGGTYQVAPVFSNVPPGSHNIIVKNTITGCESVATVVVVNALPAEAAPVAATTLQPTCIINGTITVSSPTGANYQYNMDGGTYQASPVFAGVLSGTHTIKVKNLITGCESLATTVLVNAIPTQTSPTATATQQPTCSVNTGVITVSAPIGSNYQYNIDGGTYQAGIVFSGVTAGMHNIRVRNTVTGCESATTIATINNPPPTTGPVTVWSLIQPTCISNGTITITAPAAATLQYSLDGGIYQASAVFTNVAPGTHAVRVKNTTTGCESVATNISLNPVPGAPPAPTASVTQQPACTINTGTITVTAPVAFQYSINGVNYQSGGVFSGVASGSYNVTAQDPSTGCTSSGTTVVVNPTPAIPSAPVASVTQQPTCTNTAGTITITSPLGANVQYSIDNGTYQSAVIFTNLAPGLHTVKVKNTTSGCESAITQVTVNSVPNAPAAPTATATQQTTCSLKGTITINAPIGADLQYSIDGITYQSGTAFGNLNPGNYAVTVKNTTTNCTSAFTPVTINPTPQLPATPVATVTKQPTCADNTGTITVSSPTGSSMLYNINAGIYQSGLIFSALAPGTYMLRAKNSTTNCESLPLSITISGVPGASIAPLVTGGSRCGAGSVNLAASGSGILTWYSEPALTNVVATGNTFTPSVTNTTTYYVTARGTGCESPATIVTATVNALPVPNLGVDKAICAGDQVVLNPGVFSSYIWQDNTTQPTLTVTAGGTYSVIVANATNCKASASVLVRLLNDCNDIYFPRAFTPNNDLVNDEFGPLPATSLNFVKNYNLIIYNRYGQLVFQSNDPYKKWKGIFLGKLTAGNYVWYASYTYRGVVKKNKGNILVVR